MKNQRPTLIAGAVIAALLLALTVPGVFAAGMAIGTPMPAFGLSSAGGGSVSSGSLGGKTVVVAFVDPRCTYSQAYEGRLTRLQREYSTQGVQFVLIDPNAGSAPVQGESQKGQKTPGSTLLDVSQSTARAFGATRVPEVFLFGPDGKLVYRGQIDDNSEEHMVRRENLRMALDAVLKGTPKGIASPVTSAFGCSIKANK